MIKVKSADEMLEATLNNLPTDVAIFSSAVADFKIKNQEKEKIKKEYISELYLEKNTDILKHISNHNSLRPKLVLGFSAETNNIIENSQKKIADKNCDWLIANDVSNQEIGFDSDFNEVSILYKSGEIEKISKDKKSVIANKIVRKIISNLDWSMVKVLVKKLDQRVKLPKYKTDGSSGMDLMAFIKNPINIKPGSSALIPTGVSLAFPKEFEVQIRPRSGLAAKQSIGVLNSPGTIDSDYRGELKVIIFNHGEKEFIVNCDDRIAQMILAPILKIELEEVNELPETVRGSGGFGSTGKWRKISQINKLKNIQDK